MAATQRRQLLQALIAGVGAAVLGRGPSGLGARAAAQQPPGDRLEIALLRDGLLLVRGAGGNILIHGSSTGIAMVDSGSPARAEQVVQFIVERFGPAPVEWLFNTHWHLEHSGGNEVSRHDNTKIVGHENTRLWMNTEFYVEWLDRTFAPRPAAALPTETFYSSDPQPLKLEHAGQPIEYGHLREAHTDGDIYVHFPRQNVIAAGDAVFVGQYPILDYITGGSIDGLIAATRQLVALSDADTLIVPGAGAAVGRGHLEAQVEMLSTVRERMQLMANQGKGVPEMIAAGITREFDERWGGEANLFLTNAYNSLWGISA